jgi:Fe2+ transport system protein B
MVWLISIFVRKGSRTSKGLVHLMTSKILTVRAWPMWNVGCSEELTNSLIYGMLNQEVAILLLLDSFALGKLMIRRDFRLTPHRIAWD